MSVLYCLSQLITYLHNMEQLADNNYLFSVRANSLKLTQQLDCAAHAVIDTLT